MVEPSQISRKALAGHLHRRILMQLVIFAVITVVMFGIIIIDAFTSNLNLWWILLGAVVGIGLGFAVGRAFKLKWHEDSQKVIMNIDRTGFIIIIVYVLIRSLTNSEAKQFFDGVELIAVTYSLLGGVMLGRLLGMGRKIVAVLRDQKII